MTDTLSTKTFDLKWFGTLNPKQILALVAAFAFALILTVFGFGASCMCFGMLIIAIVLCMLPRLMGVDNLKLMTVFGVVFALIVIVIGGAVTGPDTITSNDGNPSGNDYFTDIEYTYDENGVTVTATLLNDIGDNKVRFNYGTVSGVGFGLVYADYTHIDLTATGTSVTGYVELDPNSIYIGYLDLLTQDDGKVADNTGTFRTFLTGVYTGDISSVCWYGAAINTIYIMIMFFVVLFASSFMRSRMEKTREKMEQDGRLYPQGYGRCESCGTIVLPGEVNCRKCGAYIDRPEEMKPQKKDFFECSDCGAEVPANASECPKCGVKFDEDEFEVTHADGTTETTKEAFECSECGSLVPAAAAFCPKCGAKFDENEEN